MGFCWITQGGEALQWQRTIYLKSIILTGEQGIYLGIAAIVSGTAFLSCGLISAIPKVRAFFHEMVNREP